jgi:hypothetical protein
VLELRREAVGHIEEGDGLDVEVHRVDRLPPQLLGDDGTIGEVVARAEALLLLSR